MHTTGDLDSLASRHPSWLRNLGKTGLTVSALIAGGGPLGSQPELFGYDVPAQRALDVIRQIFASPITTIDTANGYSAGESERRIGTIIRETGGVPAGHWVATKVDPKNGDYSGKRTVESVQESRERLGLDFLPLVQLHDPEYADVAGLMRAGGAVDTLVSLKNDGSIGAIGVAGGDIPTLERLLDLGVFDVVLTHSRYTLIDRSAAKLIDNAHRAGIGVMNAALLGGKFLTEPARMAKYAYRPATHEMRSAAVQMQSLCSEYETDLSTAAIQFSLRDTRISTSVLGMSQPDRIASSLIAATTPLPQSFWDALEELVPPSRFWLNP